MKSLLAVFLVTSSFLFSGCMLDTRAQSKEQDEKTVIRKQVGTLQSSVAENNTRFQDVEEDVKKANGRIEALETRMQQSATQEKGRADKASSALDAKLADNDKAYREEFAKLRAEIDQLKAQVASAGEARRSAEAADAASAAAVKRDPFEAAESKFEAKSYKEAILDYQAYRKKNPTGKHFSTATLKIGSSFQEMGMIDEARAFYEEVISKYPKSKDASRAQAKLKSLKKK